MTICSGSVISRDLLQLGYKVRAATRSVARLQNLKSKFETQYGAGTFEVVEVADATAPEAYDEALKGGPRPETVTDLHLGASGFLHVATDSSFSTDTDKVSHCLALCQSDDIGQVYNDSVAFTLNALKSAAKTPSVKRVVLTSSRIAVYALKPGENVDIKDSQCTTKSTTTSRGKPRSITR